MYSGLVTQTRLFFLVPVMLTCGDKRFSPTATVIYLVSKSQTIHHPLIKSFLHDLRPE